MYRYLYGLPSPRSPWLTYLLAPLFEVQIFNHLLEYLPELMYYFIYFVRSLRYPGRYLQALILNSPSQLRMNAQLSLSIALLSMSQIQQKHTKVQTVSLDIH